MSELFEEGTGASQPQTMVALNGHDLRDAFVAATRYLERHRDAINALNVFPVPDGDTGINMLLTMRSVNEEASHVFDSSCSAVMASMAHGALLGARGNSGVILSQFFHGMARGLEGIGELNCEHLARCFELASESAYKAVSNPVDGTMLTVIRELARAATRALENGEGPRDTLSLWGIACKAARDALSITPLQLPVLKEAGVVDAGGQGIVTVLEGARRYLVGDDVNLIELDICAPADSANVSFSLKESAAPSAIQPTVQEEFLAATEDELYGYCTQFLIKGEQLDVDAIRRHMSTMAASTVVVGDQSLIKVHLHVHDPGGVISYAVSLGAISQVNMDNIDQQHQEFMAFHRMQDAASGLPGGEVAQLGTPHSPESSVKDQALALAVVAVASGDGLVQLFEQLGCACVVAGGQTMNPSTQELLDAAISCGVREVILLPNNSNIVPAALQAASIAEQGPRSQDSLGDGTAGHPHIRVIPSRTIPQGVAAMLAFNPEGTLDANSASMERAIDTVKTIEVTQAVRPATVGGLGVQIGQYIGLVDGELLVAVDSPVSALRQSVALAMDSSGSQGECLPNEVLTIYWGGEIGEEEAREAAALFQESYPELAVELVYGGQPFYHYIASVE